MQLTNNPIFGILLTFITYIIGVKINQKFKKTFLNPILIALVLIITFLYIFKIPYENYCVGGDIITMILTPATAVIALSVYRQRNLLREHYVAIIVGTGMGSLASISSIYILGTFLKVDAQTIASLLPKSVTTPIAMAISTSIGGMAALTIIAVLITGVLGSIFAPLLIKMFKIKHPVAQGVGIGSCSHALGTSKAIELGEDIGAMSGISIAFSGLFTVVFALLFF
ncbi:MAG: LrgB family protein [Sphaerochaeta sp.]